MNPRRQLAAWSAVTVAGVLIAFAPAVVGLRTLSQRDTDLLYAPVRTLVVEGLRAGRLPLWNPYEGMGMPLFAQGIHSVLHPISLLAAALAPTSIDFLILAYLVTAALGAFALARALGSSDPASAGAGLAFALSGYSASMTGNLVFLAGLSTLPWLLAAARAAGAGSRWGAVATALATACAFLSGDAQVTLVGLALGTLLAADAGGTRGAARALAGLAAGILLSAVQIVPTGEFLPLSARGAGLTEIEKAQWPLAPGRLLEWIVPGLFRGPLDEVPVASSGDWLDPVFSESVYLGAPLLVAAALGATAFAAKGRRRTGILLACAAGCLLWLALGHHLGARQLLDGVPVWSQFRYSEKLMAPLGLSLCALAALGIDAFGAGRLPAPWARVIAAFAVCSGALLLTLHLAPEATQGLAARLLGGAGPFYRYTLASGLPHLLSALLALLAVDRIRAGSARTASLAILVALAPALAVYSGAHLGSPELRRFSNPLRLQTDSPAPRILHPLERVQAADDPLGPIDATVSTESAFLAPSTNVARRVDSIEPYSGLEPRRLTSLAGAVAADRPRAFRRFGLTHVVVAFPRDEPSALLAATAVEGGLLVQRDERFGLELWAVPHRPWAFFPRRVVATEQEADAQRILLDLVARGEDDTVVVEAAAPPPAAPGRVLHVERGNESIAVEAESAGPSLLVVQDAWWPGWRAFVDGAPTEILAADRLVRAVRWPAGRHRLLMVYDPPALPLGLALTALGAALVALLAVLGVRRHSPDVP